MSVLVSAIIPTHNRLKLLKKSITSVLNQTYEEIELIVVDDASTDGTKEYCLQKNNFIYLRIEPEDSRGGNHARNLGIKKAHGEYIAFLDDDDEWLPEKISKQVEFLNNNPEIGLVYSGCIVREVTHDSEIEKEQYPFRKNKGNLNKRVLYTIPCITTTIMVRKELLFKAGLFDESLSFWQETELMIRLCQITEIDFIDECLSICRVDVTDKNRLSNKYDNWLKAVDQIMEKHKLLYNKLTFIEKLMQKLLYYNEALVRSKNSNIASEYHKNKVKSRFYYLVTLPYRICVRISLMGKAR